MTDVERYELYLRTIGQFIKERAIEMREKVDSADESDRLFYSGKLQGFYAVISVMQGQARGLEIPLDVLSLQDVDPDRDLT